MPALAERKRNTKGLQSWLNDIAAYERAFKQWEGRVDKIVKRYCDDPRTGRQNWTDAKFNVLWSNVQTLTAATFSRLPKPDVSRRFRDQDPVGRVASMILERVLDYHVQHYPQYASMMSAVVLDRFLGGRGTAWVRYEPHFRAVQGTPIDGDQVTDDVDEAHEELDYECVAVDYVHAKDFGHSVARKWEEVNRVWRKVYMPMPALVERFGEAKAKTIPLDAIPEELKQTGGYKEGDPLQQACIYEGWDKDEGVAVWFAKGVKDFLDRKTDPLKLAEFFPCPRPLYATLSNNALVPVPDFVIYQDQANEMDLLADKIDGLVKALKVCGGYDSSIPELARIFTEAENGTLIPVKNWAAFAEKNGLAGALSLVDLKPIAEALRAAYEAFQQVLNQIYDLTGISDIVRGQSDANETATAQQLKGQYANLRLKTLQDGVARFATDTLRLMAQVVCGKFAVQTIAATSAADQLSEHDKQLLQPALELLLGPERIQNPDAEQGPNPLRAFRIEIAADSMVLLDERAEKEARTEFLTATSGFIANIAKSLQGVPPEMGSVLIPLYMEMLKFGVQGYKVGKSIEGAFDEAADKLREMAQAPQQPPPDPVAMQEQAMQAAKAQVAQENATKEIGITKRAAYLDIREMKFGVKQELAKQQEQMRAQQAENDNKLREQERTHAEREFSMKAKETEGQLKAKQDRASFDEERAKHAIDTVQKTERETKGRDDLLRQVVETIAQSNAETQAQIAQLVKAMGAPKRIVRGSDGRAAGVEMVQ